MNAFRFALILLLSALLLACSQPAPTPRASIADIEAAARIDIPDAAADVQGYVETGGPDSFAAVRFTLPASELDRFLKQSGYSEPLKPVAPPLLMQFADRDLASDIPGWPTPEQWEALAANGRLAGVSQTEPGFSRSAIVHYSDADRPTVYLIHFEL